MSSSCINKIKEGRGRAVCSNSLLHSSNLQATPYKLQKKKKKKKNSFYKLQPANKTNMREMQPKHT